MEPFEFYAPKSVPEALDLLADTDAAPLGGGTALIPMMRGPFVPPRRLVWLGRVPDLQRLRIADDGSLFLGAGCTLAEVARSPLVRTGWPAIARAAEGIGNVRVRAVATLGGHLAHADPCQDLPPLLLALDARLHLAGPAGPRTMPLTGFFVDYLQTALSPGELITGITIGPLAPTARALYIKFAPRSPDDFPTVGVAGCVEMAADGTASRACVALAGAGPTPLLVRGAAEALTGRRPTPNALVEAADAAAAEAAPLSDLRGTAGYKRAMCRVWTRRCLEALVQELSIF